MDHHHHHYDPSSTPTSRVQKALGTNPLTKTCLYRIREGGVCHPSDHTTCLDAWGFQQFVCGPRGGQQLLQERDHQLACCVRKGTNAGTMGEEWVRFLSLPPFTLPCTKLQELTGLHVELSVELARVLLSWGKENSWLPKALTLSPRTTSMLLRYAEFVKGLLDTKLPVGSFIKMYCLGPMGAFGFETLMHGLP